MPVPVAQPRRPQGHLPPQGYTPGRDHDADPGAFHTEIVYALTPETEHSVHDFWMVARDFAVDDPEVSEYLHTNNHTVVMQDVHALELVEQVIAEEEATGGTVQELSINIDTGALVARARSAAPSRRASVHPVEIDSLFGDVKHAGPRNSYNRRQIELTIGWATPSNCRLRQAW